MSRQHPWPHVTGNRILILILVSEILDHCQNLLDASRIINLMYLYENELMRVPKRDRTVSPLYPSLFQSSIKVQLFKM